MKKLFSDLLNLVYPNLCLICNESLIRSEQFICLACLHNIPRTNYHLQPENEVEKRFWGKVPIHRGTSFFFFYKGSPFQQLLHELKYRNNPGVGIAAGKFAAADLLQSPEFTTVDTIIPVPLHPKKFRKRGYNQSEQIAVGLSAIMNIPVDTQHLIRIRETATQTRKNVYERFLNTSGIFALTDPLIFRGKHLLLVDDVLTTGSTLEACIQTLMETDNVKISVFTLAVA